MFVIEFQSKFIFYQIKSKLNIYKSNKIRSSQRNESDKDPCIKVYIGFVLVSVYIVILEIICA